MMGAIPEVGGELYVSVEGIRHPKLEKWYEIVEQQSESQREKFWTRLVEQWIEVVALDLGYTIYQSTDFVFVSAVDQKATENLLSVARRTVDTLKRGLQFDAQQNAPTVIILFSDVGEYQRYLVHTYALKPEEAIPSAGVFLSGSTIPHIALIAGDSSQAETTLAHELSHLAVSHFPLPVWLDEGLAKIVEQEVMGIRSFRMTPERVREHQEVWIEEKLTKFFSGDAFADNQFSSELNYELAEIFVRNLMNADAEAFRDLLETADSADGGERALSEIYGIGLSDLAAVFLDQET